ncbi:hypothetical protein K4K49_004936 [Colletotrichum sp. SAR 10_70]|nr:hypothetical protein K4K50_009070 [Colletotrichum sp. SAR 10_71]KAI8168830.1 hypothetical protein K4K49_004936 [Colletotrichum sp. SAR 10_70]
MADIFERDGELVRVDLVQNADISRGAEQGDWGATWTSTKSLPNVAFGDEGDARSKKEEVSEISKIAPISAMIFTCRAANALCFDGIKLTDHQKLVDSGRGKFSNSASGIMDLDLIDYELAQLIERREMIGEYFSLKVSPAGITWHGEHLERDHVFAQPIEILDAALQGGDPAFDLQ